ncbi:MAG TPA: Maf family nucleotide pyrophosphatase [Candidatus Acidoferrum sp.]|nr:Maf family nucleotide pyrophosphatase [Candidatus Acidoferrum sp.]
MSLPLILASSSPYRRALLERLRLPFGCERPDVDETPLPGEAVQTMTARLALAKARAVATRHPQAWIIGSDQACVRDDDATIIGKPGSFDNAVVQLRACSGRSVNFHTALVLFNSETGRHLHSHDVYQVRFRQLADAEITRYLQLEQPYDCAGSFKAESLGIALFDSMEGNDFHSLIGLPLISLCRLLRQAGFDPLG